MNKYLCVFIGCISVAGILHAQQQNSYASLDAAAVKIEPKLIAWRRDFHEHPELGNLENRTAEIIAKHLQSLGMEVKTGVAITGVIGILKGALPGPVIALRADMDALPVTERTPVPFASKVRTVYNGVETGVMHACGHDTHMAILMGVAEILSSMKNQLRGTVKFIFQPAEEGTPPGVQGGAELMVKEGALENPKVEAIFGLHINSQIEMNKLAYHPGSFMAGVNDVRIIVKGKTSHGAAPWYSIDPIVVSAQIINNLQTIVSRNLNITTNPGIVSIGSIHGGNRSNIIPDQVELWGTLRSFSKADEAMINERVRQIATKTAESAGATAEVTIPYSSHYPITYNDPGLVEKTLPSLQSAAGKENVIYIPPLTVSEDFSFFQEKVPGFYFNLGGMPMGMDPQKAPPHHSADFNIDEGAMVLGVKAFCHIVTDYSKKAK
ncbi:MAG: amidohydrolase [Chitinophagales bacterium]